MTDDLPYAVDFTVLGQEATMKVRIRDQGGDAVIKVKVILQGIHRTGSDPATGFPTYNIQPQLFISMTECDKTLRVKPPLRERLGFG